MPCGLALTACAPQKTPNDALSEFESGIVAPIEGFNFGFPGANYVIRLEGAFWSVSGDVTVFAFDSAGAEGAPVRLGEVAVEVSSQNGRNDDGRALIRRDHEDRVWTFVGACL